MRGRVIDINERQVYLEVDEQLRFRSDYRAKAGNRLVARDDRVEFVIACDSGHPCVIIENIVRPQRIHHQV